ncbi:hypothetical protein WG901_22900 [Novosphingobium sp. PS1R-30]|uniref:Uncharacterized protein n=1 Tax=Novosphingobium anseongense TaxID=3133436 RepID=A0ABU8S3R1_9SPHN
MMKGYISGFAFMLTSGLSGAATFSGNLWTSKTQSQTASAGQTKAKPDPASPVPAASMAPATIVDPMLSGLSADLLDQKSTSFAWHQLQELTSTSGAYGRTEGPDSSIRLSTKEAGFVVTTANEYKQQLETRMKAEGWWDDATNAPILSKRDTETRATDPVSGNEVVTGRPSGIIGWNVSRLDVEGSKFAWEMSRQELDSTWQKALLDRAAQASSPVTVNYGQVLDQFLGIGSSKVERTC